MIKISKLINNNYGLEFEFSLSLISTIKELPIRRWDPEEKIWIIPQWELKALKEKLPYENFQLQDQKETAIQSNKPKALEKIPSYLYDYQAKSFNFLANKEYAADFSECGTGKTVTMLAVIDAQLKRKEVERVLIICPKSIIRSVWATDISRFIKDYQPMILSGSSLNKERMLRNQKAEIYILNYDSVRLLIKPLSELFKDQMIILDESTKIKNAKTKVSKACTILGNLAKLRFIMTGTPTPNSLLEIYPQARFLSPDIMGPSFWFWLKAYFHPGGFNGYEWLANPETFQTIKTQMKPHSIRWKKEQCIQLPSITRSYRYVTLDKEQIEKYNQMKEDLIFELGDKIITAQNFLTRLIKLNEISNSFIIDGEGKPEWFKNLSKIKELDNILEEVVSNGNKAIIWSIYRTEIQKIFERYKKKYKPVVLMGGISDSERNRGLVAFKENEENKILIAHPRTAAHGLNLSVANYSIWLSWDYSFESYEQANYRINRIGQEKKMTIIHLVAENTIDTEILKKLVKKQKINSSILKALQIK